MSFFNRHGRWRAQLLSAAVVLAVGAVCVSCGAAEKPAALVGQWEHYSGATSGKPEAIELFGDGTGVVDKMSVTWKVENKRLVLLSAMMGLSCDYKVSGYELVLTYDDERSATFVKKGKSEEYKKNEEKKKEEEKKRESERIKKEAEARIGKISTYFTDSRNGQKYRAVKIGDKSWMAENLNYQTGTSWCYGDENSNCKKYGRLYDWNTAKKACPSGWHLPSRAEWDDLMRAVGSKKEKLDVGNGIAIDYWDGAGKKLKSTTDWNDNDDGSSGNGTDEFGFSALPGGHRGTDGSFYDAGGYGDWWTATEYGGGKAYNRRMYYDGDNVYELNDGVSYGFSVRCLGD